VNNAADRVSALATTAAVALSMKNLALGFSHTCGVTTAKLAYCWGRGSLGQLGNGETFYRRSRPTAVKGGLAFVQVSANEKHSCGVTSDGKAYCWGLNPDGRLGDGTLTSRSAPVPVVGGLKFTQVRTGWDHTCGLTTLKQAYCWGNNLFGQTGIGSAGGTRRRPVAVGGGQRFRQLSAGRYYTCGLTTASRVLCWGSNGAGTLGTGMLDDELRPTAVAGALDFVQLDAGPNHACAVTAENQAYCWGLNDAGQVGDGSTVLRHYAPTTVAGELQFNLIRVGGIHTCGRTLEGKAYCWGYNGHGRLGDGTNTGRRSPTPVVGDHTFGSLALGYHHSCGVTTGKLAYCWGFNGYGQVGDATFTDRWAPTRIAGAN
jgi:alpha-tubulin suppressor-like RCC1 family protein